MQYKIILEKPPFDIEKFGDGFPTPILDIWTWNHFIFLFVIVNLQLNLHEPIIFIQSTNKCQPLSHFKYILWGILKEIFNSTYTIWDPPLFVRVHPGYSSPMWQEWTFFPPPLGRFRKMNRGTYRHTVGQMDRRTSRQMDIQINEQMDNEMDRLMDIRIDEHVIWKNRQAYK